jgi:hypothetical protein
MSNIGQTTHGVRVENAPARYIIFAGPSYNPADPENEVVAAQPTIVNDGPKEFLFAQLSGDVAAPGTVSISDGVHSGVISLSHEGQINW